MLVPWKRCEWVQVVLALWMLLTAACTGTPDRISASAYRLDSATHGCKQRPDLCARVAGEEALLPTLQGMKAVGSAVRTGAGVLRVLEAATKAVVERELKVCAEQARSQVLLDQMGGRSPTREECNEVVDDARTRRRITRAMQLGCFMHEVALTCARKALEEQIPGRLSLEQRYRYDRPSKVLELVSKEEVRSLLRQGCSEELTGTLVPDVVIHSGNPLEAEAVYDFKFPCVNTDEAPRSRRYPPGHPYQGVAQEALYREAFQTRIMRVVPRVGIIP
jgi:hypothetical protein